MAEEQIGHLDDEALKIKLKIFADQSRLKPQKFVDLYIPQTVSQHLQDRFYKGVFESFESPTALDFGSITTVEDTMPGIGAVKTFIFTVELHRKSESSERSKDESEQRQIAPKRSDGPFRTNKGNVNYEMTYLVDVDHEGAVLGFGELGFCSIRFAANQKDERITKNIPHGVPFVQWDETLPAYQGKLLSMRRLVLMTAYSKRRYDDFVHSGDMGEYRHGISERDPEKLGKFGKLILTWIHLAQLGLATEAPVTKHTKEDRFVLNKVYEN